MRLLAALALALLAPAAAHADSLVYSKGGDVWAARPDGSGARRIASGYQRPTQADDGTILAQDGTRFVRLSRSGRVLARFDSVMTGLPAGIDAVGPFDPQISPDGASSRTGSGCTAPGTTTAMESTGRAPAR